jgi:hypothetical protein
MATLTVSKQVDSPMLQSLLDCNAAHVERGDVVAAAA